MSKKNPLADKIATLTTEQRKMLLDALDIESGGDPDFVSMFEKIEARLAKLETPASIDEPPKKATEDSWFNNLF